MSPTNFRPELSEHLRRRLEAFAEGFRQNLALIGPAGCGKTFLLQPLVEQPPAQLRVIYCPAYQEACLSFLNRLRGAVLHAALGQPQGASLERLFGLAEEGAPRTVAALRAAEPLLARRLYGEALTRILDAIPELVEEGRRPCVLMLDEFLLLEDLGFPHAFHEIGKRVMTWPAILFILTSSSPYRARLILRERLQLLFGQFELVTLETVEAPTAMAWVRRELRGLRGGKAFSPFLINWLGGHPWYLSVFLRRLKELAALRRTRELSEALFFKTAWDVVGDAEGTLHQWCGTCTERLARNRDGQRSMEALIEIARGARTTTEIGRRIGRARIPPALQTLVEHDLVQRRGACWWIPDPILRCWLTGVLAPQRGGAAVDEGTLRSRFEEYLAGSWMQWVASQELPWPQQVTNLLRQFRDETVSLDEKTGRLPRFETVTAHTPQPGSAETYVLAEGDGKRWCCTVEPSRVDENAVARFEAFCRAQAPKPSRKVVVARYQVEQNARLLAKANHMWVWESHDLAVLQALYGGAASATGQEAGGQHA